MINPHICSQCDTTASSCCTLRTEDNDGLPAPVSEAEIRAILNTLKEKTRDDILEAKPNSRQFIEQMAILFPDMAGYVQHVFPMDGVHMVLKTQGDDCIFKEKAGCTLPNDIRPHFCRIYPFWFFGEEPQVFQDNNCLALQKNRTIPEVLLSLGTNSKSLKQLHAKIFDDWGFSRFRPLPKRIAVL